MKTIIKLALTFSFLIIPHVHADTIRTADGISCSFDSGDSEYELQSYLETGNFDSNSNGYWDNQYDSRLGVKFTYKFGGPERLDCNKLYQLELRAKEAKVRELEAKIAALEVSQKIKW